MDLARPLDIASGAEADRYLIFSFREQRELGVESGDTVDLREGHAKAVRDHLLYLDGQIPVDALRQLQYLHQRAFMVLMLLYHLFELLLLLGGAVKLYRGSH